MVSGGRRISLIIDLRRDESLEQKALYIRRNPVVKGLCSTPEEWPWVLDSDCVRRALEVERALPRAFFE